MADDLLVCCRCCRVGATIFGQYSVKIVASKMGTMANLRLKELDGQKVTRELLDKKLACIDEA